MVSLQNFVLLTAGMAATPIAAAPFANSTSKGCGEANVFYTGLPPFHPLVLAQGHDGESVEYGLRKGPCDMVKAGFNVHVVWAGPETPISTMEDRLAQSGTEFDLVAIGMGIRGAGLVPLVERFEDLIDMYKRKVPNTPIVFNFNPESMVWSASHRYPMETDCAAAGMPGKLIGYEEICGTLCDHSTGNNTNPKSGFEPLIC